MHWQLTLVAMRLSLLVSVYPRSPVRVTTMQYVLRGQPVTPAQGQMVRKVSSRGDKGYGTYRDYVLAGYMYVLYINTQEIHIRKKV